MDTNNFSQQNGGGLPPKDYLIEAILVTLFCCLPFGIVGIVKATEVKSKYKSGDIIGANQSSLEARKWIKYGVISGIILGLLYLVISAVAVVARFY